MARDETRRARRPSPPARASPDAKSYSLLDPIRDRRRQSSVADFPRRREMIVWDTTKHDFLVLGVELSLRRIDAALRRGGAVDIIPPLRSCRRSVHEAHFPVPNAKGQRSEKGLGVVGQDLAGPADNGPDRLVHVQRCFLDSLVVIALDDDRAFGCMARDDVDDLLRIRSVPDEIAKEGIARGAALARVLQARVQRLEIAVNVGKQGNDQLEQPVTARSRRTLYRIAKRAPSIGPGSSLFGSRRAGDPFSLDNGECARR